MKAFYNKKIFRLNIPASLLFFWLRLRIGVMFLITCVCKISVFGMVLLLGTPLLKLFLDDVYDLSIVFNETNVFWVDIHVRIVNDNTICFPGRIRV